MYYIIYLRVLLFMFNLSLASASTIGPIDTKILFNRYQGYENSMVLWYTLFHSPAIARKWDLKPESISESTKDTK